MEIAPASSMEDMILSADERRVLDFLILDENWEYRSVTSIYRGLNLSQESVLKILGRLSKIGFVFQSKKVSDCWGSYRKVKPPVEMSREERQPGEQELWDKAHPVKLEPSTFSPAVKKQVYDKIDDAYQEAYSYLAGVSAGDKDVHNHQQHKRSLSVVIDKLPVGKIVQAISQAIAHSREVSLREHIKGDRSERVNQFIVSLRRQFGYMPDEFRTEREFLSAQLARKEVWYDIGVLNPAGVSGFNSYSSLKQRDVENWLAQAEAITPTTGDLKAAIERDLERIKGNLLVAQSCNQAADEISRNADKVVAEMAALAESM